MAIVINGSGTVTGISVGGLPDGIVDAGTLATNSVDSAELIDGAVDASHLAGGDNTPSFKVTQNSVQSIGTGAFTKVENFGTENWDTDSAFASNKFTVPSGQDGKYWFQATTELAGIDDGEIVNMMIYKNGSGAFTARWYAPSSADIRARVQGVISLVATDYVEAYIYHNEGGSVNTNTGETTFTGFKLAGV